jgi:hypothetical protein
MPTVNPIFDSAHVLFSIRLLPICRPSMTLHTYTPSDLELRRQSRIWWFVKVRWFFFCYFHIQLHGRSQTGWSVQIDAKKHVKSAFFSLRLSLSAFSQAYIDVFQPWTSVDTVYSQSVGPSWCVLSRLDDRGNNNGVGWYDMMHYLYAAALVGPCWTLKVSRFQKRSIMPGSAVCSDRFFVKDQWRNDDEV